MSTVMALAGLAAVAITVLYVMKLRKRRIQVPFSPLWQKVLVDKRQTSDFWRHFKRILSWLLHILMAALLLFALTDPHLETEVTQGRHIVILVDNSASMGATDVSGGVNRLGIAKKKAREILDTMSPEDRIMLVTFNDQLQPLSPFVQEASVLEQPLRTIEVVATGTRYEEALAFAADSLREKADGELVILSDGAGFDATRLDGIVFGDKTAVRHLKVGEASGNLAVTAFNVRRYLSNKLDFELFVGIKSYFDRPVDAEIEIYADGKLVDTKPVKLEANEEYRRFYPSQAVSGEKLEARVRLKTADARDVFPLDDRAYALLPAVRRTRVQVVTEGNLYLEGPLLLNANLDVTRTSPDEYDPGALDFDVTFFDRFVPEDLPERGNFVFFSPIGENSPWEIQGAVEDPIITRVKRSHPLLRWITLKDLNIGVAAKWKLQRGDEVVAASALGTPILVTRDDGPRRMVGASFDLRNSDFPLRVAFPVFLLNIVDYFSLDEGSLVETYTTGETWSIPVDTKAEEVEVTRPDGTSFEAPIYDGRAVVYGEDTGFYSLKSGDFSKLVAGNLSNPTESKIAPSELRVGEKEVQTDTDALVFDRHEIWIWALLALVLLLLMEWVTYNRRVTV